MSIEDLSKYSDAAGRSAGVVISRYSSSFGLACRMLGPRARRDIENIYALVRVADEVVDGAAAAAGLDVVAVGEQLNRLEQETELAMLSGYSTNLVVHAFAGTARDCGIQASLTQPFFASMRADLTVTRHDADSLEEYIYGSAEVVGLMCLRVFQTMPGASKGHDQELERAARSLGSAFQKVNFLRDLAADGEELGRNYVAASGTAPLDEAAKDHLIAQIRSELIEAQAGLPLLAPGARRAVGLAHGLFVALVDRLDAAPAEHLLQRRIRVPGAEKASIALRAIAARSPRKAKAV
ncbi:MAG: phytoene/squalene synthase family protein [Arthrobacter sp.]|uniref:phytoene/squalene synthase family protein n=1 Tax=unclassified Arthrobacter TaxID=235627 RepID=UPI0026517ABF|nr:squalene/phytoene synthase family protein [Micrococcaceae bacterium]MDN5812587.1 squalene/phytoene synthase family protein [Micrococcaceae bacterium]MDN5824018.1 squalene/phytoene synthase family protein [Micrococcaceae bacterium]MDN5878361.1 squalene/phytoene synthase family protein [Micrococcaceae bacterium]MDN5885924.1 squalene/phytoene synthase family protein [Micrococcaceae bacterium]